MKNLHDKLFKQMMSLKSQAVALATSFLPAEVLAEIDLDSFDLSNVSFINEELQEYFADIVYNCNSTKNKKIKIAFLLEHKSYYDPHLPLQLLRYLLEGYDYQHVKEGKKELSLIIPVVIYHGDKKWKKREMKEMVTLSNPVLQRYIPNFFYDFIDLINVSDDYLKNQTVGHLLPATFMLFKHKGDKKYFLENMKEIHIFVQRTVTEEERKLFIESLKSYIFGLFEISKQETMAYDNMLREVIDERLYLPGSAMDTFLKEGRAEGKIEGKAEGEATANLMNNLSFCLNLLKSLPNLSNSQIAALSKSKEKFVAELKKIVTHNTAAKAKKMILKEFFDDIKLDDKQMKEVLKDIDGYYKKCIVLK